jgi:hypothetical protein
VRERENETEKERGEREKMRQRERGERDEKCEEKKNFKELSNKVNFTHLAVHQRMCSIKKR